MRNAPTLGELVRDHNQIVDEGDGGNLHIISTDGRTALL